MALDIDGCADGRLWLLFVQMTDAYTTYSCPCASLSPQRDFENEVRAFSMAWTRVVFLHMLQHLLHKHMASTSLLSSSAVSSSDDAACLHTL
jgi:hypothetical protein